MNLLDTASLVVTPNGYKASKLYSIIPSDGSGDMTFARTGDTATRVNSSGLIETVLANKPRLDYLGSTCPKLLLESQRTNLIPYSQTFDNSYWEGYASVIANTAISPDGTQNADTNRSAGIYPSAGGVGSATVVNTASIFAKANPSGASTLSFGMNRYGAGDGITCTFNLTTGTAGTPTLSGTASSGSAKIESYGNGWYRCIITCIASTTAGTLSFNPVNNCYIWGAQLEAGSYATSYIPTTTASVTRNADSCNKTGISSLIGQTEGTILWDINLNTRNISGGYFGLRDISIPNYIMFGFGYSSFNAQIYNSGTNIIYSTFSNSSTGRFKLCISYKNNDYVFYANGNLIGSASTGTVPTCNEVFNQTEYLVNSISLWKTRLTNQELVTLTTI